jgi:hypothetical protein
MGTQESWRHILNQKILKRYPSSWPSASDHTTELYFPSGPAIPLKEMTLPEDTKEGRMQDRLHYKIHHARLKYRLRSSLRRIRWIGTTEINEIL